MPRIKSRKVHAAISGNLSILEVQKILDGFSPAELALFKRVSDIEKNQRTTDLASAYVVGRELAEVEADQRAYGKRFVQTMARLLGHQQGYLYRRKLFYARFPTEDEFERLTRLRLPSGAPLTFTHVSHVLDLPDEEERWEFLEKSAELGWSTTDLKKEISKLKTGKGDRSNATGRPPAVPPDLESKLAQVDESLPVIRKRALDWASPENGLLAALVKVPQEHLKQSWLAVLDNQVEEFEQTLEALGRCLPEWREARSRIAAYLSPVPPEPQAATSEEPGKTDQDYDILMNLFAQHEAQS